LDNKYVLIQQGIINAGKTLVVGSDGKVTLEYHDLTEFRGPYASVGSIPGPYDTNDIYLVGTSEPYDMYAYIDTGSGYAFKKIGNTTVDVSGKVDKTVGTPGVAGYKLINNDTGFTSYNASSTTTYEYGYKASGDNVLQVISSSITSGLKVSPTAAELAVSNGTSAGRLIVGSDYKAYYVKGTGAPTAKDEIATVGDVDASGFPVSVKYNPNTNKYDVVIENTSGRSSGLFVYTLDDTYRPTNKYNTYTTVSGVNAVVASIPEDPDMIGTKFILITATNYPTGTSNVVLKPTDKLLVTPSYNFSGTINTSNNYSTWSSAQIVNYINTNVHQIPVGGAAGDVLTKTTASDYDVSW